MEYLLEFSICAVIGCLIGFGYVFAKYVEVKFEDGED